MRRVWRNWMAFQAAVVAVWCAACGGSTGGAASSTEQPTLEIRRTGGIAGFDDRLVIAADGTAQLSTKDGRRTRCRLGSDLQARVDGVDWAALRSAPPPRGRSDVMTYVVRTARHRAVLDADLPGPAQHDAVDIAAALFAAVLAAQGGPAGCTATT